MIQWVKSLPAMQELQEMWVWSLCQEHTLEVAWQPTSVFLPGESHGQRSLVDQSMGLQKAGHSWSDWVCTPSPSHVSYTVISWHDIRSASHLALCFWCVGFPYFACFIDIGISFIYLFIYLILNIMVESLQKYNSQSFHQIEVWDLTN